jgi:predicted alpha/beta superfamily hydrolase
MRASLLTFFVLLYTTQLTRAQTIADSIQVTFRVTAPALPDSAQVYLTGSVPALGNWDPMQVVMEKSGTHSWSKTVYLTDRSVQYKFTLGSWHTEATDSKGQALPNYTLQLYGDTTVEHSIDHWLKKGDKPLSGGIRGTVLYHRNITADSLKSRDLVVWLPPGYEKGNKRYPVLYMHDGQNIFDPATSSFGVDWRIDEIADSLMRNKLIAPAIIVGINNTPDRMQEHVPGNIGNAYMELVVNTVKPLIDQNYRTKTGPKHTLTGGSSAGGIMAFMLAWEYPQVFSQAICMSPAFKIMHIDYVKDVQAYTGKKKKLRFYIDNGGIDLEARLQPGIDEMLEALQQKGYRQGKDFYWMQDTNALHNEAAWSKRLPQALKFTLGK